MSIPTQAPSIDHLVVLVQDLDHASSRWQSLGFTLSPRGEHSPHIGTANHTIMLREDYLELLVTRGETAVNTDWRSMMATAGEGLYGTVLAATDIDALYALITARGIQATEPMAFERPVDIAPGQTVPARFRVSWAASGSLPGLKLFACEHLTREAVWLPELCRHANSAVGILGYDMTVPDLAEAQRSWARLPCEITQDAHSLHIRLGRHMLCLTERKTHPARVNRLRLRVSSIETCRQALVAGGSTFMRDGNRLIVPSLNGIELAFSE